MITARQIRGMLIAMVVGFLLPSGRVVGQDAQHVPLLLSQVEGELHDGMRPARILAIARDNCLGFLIDNGAVVRLRNAGADDELIQNLRQVCNPAQAQVDAAVAARMEEARREASSSPQSWRGDTLRIAGCRSLNEAGRVSCMIEFNQAKGEDLDILRMTALDDQLGNHSVTRVNWPKKPMYHSKQILPVIVENVSNDASTLSFTIDLQRCEVGCFHLATGGVSFEPVSIRR